MTKTGWWSIEYTIKPNEMDLEHIAELIKEGFTSGQIVQEDEDDEVQEED